MKRNVILAIVAAIVVVTGAVVAFLLLQVGDAAPEAPPARSERSNAEDAVPGAVPNRPTIAPRDVGGGAEKAKANTAPKRVERFGGTRINCDFACGAEAECGFRSFDECAAASCADGVRVASNGDGCFVDADSCLVGADCFCKEACWKRGECTKDHGHDVECERACHVVVTQDPVRSYRENRCIIEQKCGDIAVCGGA